MADKFNETGVTQIVGSKDSQVAPLMNYTAITTHGEMASAFVNHIIHYSRRIIPDHKITIEDLITICHAALEKDQQGVTLLEGKFLRGRISEQLARARRYNEIFSLIVLKLRSGVNDASYEAIIDALRERMRRSDMVFTFRNRIFLMLPHTDLTATVRLIERLRGLVQLSFEESPLEEVNHLAFPSPDITKSSQVLDWAEDQLR